MNVDLQFATPWLLYALWLVPAIGVWWWFAELHREKRVRNFISAPAMQAKLCPQSSPMRFRWQAGLVLVGMFCLLFAAAGPRWGTKEEIVYDRGRDLVIALDVSMSMLANDLHPNRLQRAKADIVDLIKDLRGDRAALLVFRHKSALLCPLTTDYAYLRQALDSANVDSAPRGETDIGDAILRAMEAFDADEGAHRAIILISDGEDLSGRVMTAAEQAAEKGIPIFTVGLGNRTGAKIPGQGQAGPYMQYQGKDITTTLDDKTLHLIAEKTGGAYVEVGTASTASTTLGTVYRNHLRDVSTQDWQETLQRRHVERFQLFLLPGLLCLIFAAGLSRGRLSTGRHQGREKGQQGPEGRARRPAEPLKNIALLAAAALMLPLAAQPDTNAVASSNRLPETTAAPATDTSDIPAGRDGARVAQKLYVQGKHEQAAAAYLKAAQTTGGSAERDFRYNAAVALFKAGKYDEATRTFQDLTEYKRSRKANIPMYLGSALYRASEDTGDEDNEQADKKAQLLRQAGEAFNEAARTQPDNETAERNLNVVLDELPEADLKALTARLMAQYEESGPFKIADDMLKNQRSIIEEIPAAFTNTSPQMIKQLEALAVRQKTNADLWIPLKNKLTEAMSGQQADHPDADKQLDALEEFQEATKSRMKDSADCLRNLDSACYDPAFLAEEGVYQLWKNIAPYPILLQEDLRRQTNAIGLSDIETAPDPVLYIVKRDQDEALGLTRLFTERFAAAIPEQGEQSPPPASDENGVDPNTPDPISAETRQKILDLAGMAASEQELASDLVEKKDLPGSLDHQRKSHDILKEIEKLLPKQSEKSTEQKEDENSEDKEEQKSPQQSQEDSPQSQENTGQQDMEEQQPEDQQMSEQQEQGEKKDMAEEQIQQLLEKALEREKEHEAEKRRRNRGPAIRAIGRDW